MKLYNLNDFIKGWIIGNFYPSLLNTNDVEVAIKRYIKDDYDESHYHKIATEYTIIVDGEVRMNDKFYKKDDVIIIEPGDITDFEVLSDNCTTVVIKIPGVNNDKYIK